MINYKIVIRALHFIPYHVSLGTIFGIAVMSKGKEKAVNPAPLEDRMDHVERMLERLVEVMLIRESLQHRSHHKKPRTESVKSGDASGTNDRPAKCPECKKYHRGVYFRKTGACYKCGQQGHHIKNYPK